MTFEARQLFAGTRDDIKKWAGENVWFYDSNGDAELYVSVERGEMTAEQGDWITRDKNGKYEVFKPESFATIFEPADA